MITMKFELIILFLCLQFTSYSQLTMDSLNVDSLVNAWLESDTIIFESDYIMNCENLDTTYSPILIKFNKTWKRGTLVQIQSCMSVKIEYWIEKKEIPYTEIEEVKILNILRL